MIRRSCVWGWFSAKSLKWLKIELTIAMLNHIRHQIEHIFLTATVAKQILQYAL